jgi:hypothetical protein
MMRVFILFFLTSLAATNAFAATSCPPYIDVKPQELRTEMPGWKPFVDSTSTRYTLSAVTVYNGEPGLMASLVPDASSASYADWNLYENGKEKYYLACAYDHTSIQLTMRLDKEFTRCRVTYQRGYNTNGTPLPYSVTCN